nr:MAG TPA: hypothetical protein [Caudoviricetes sp.]
MSTMDHFFWSVDHLGGPFPIWKLSPIFREN